MKNEENKIHRGKLIIRNRIGNSIKFPLASIEFMQIYVLRESCGILAGFLRELIYYFVVFYSDVMTGS